MRMHTLVLRDDADGIKPYTGFVGHVRFKDGVSTETHDVDDWRVHRMLSAEDGGANGYPPMHIMCDPPATAPPSSGLPGDRAPSTTDTPEAPQQPPKQRRPRRRKHR